MNYPPSDVPAFVFWLMPDEDPLYEDWPHSTPLRAWQRGRCAMCQVTDFFDRDLVEDHDHETGMVRGLLCRGCNATEPHNESAAFVAWRSGLNSAAAIGYDEQYVHPLGYGAVSAARPMPDSDLDLIAEAVTR